MEKDSSSVVWNNEFEAASLLSDTPYGVSNFGESSGYIRKVSNIKFSYKDASSDSRPTTSCRLLTSFYGNFDDSRNNISALSKRTT